VTLVWIDEGRRVREQLDSGVVYQRRELEEAGPWPLFDSSWVFSADPVPLSVRQVAQRSGIAVQADDAASFLIPGANRCVAVVDRERGVVLSAEALRDDEPLLIEEIVEVVFDEALDPGLFEAT
jgi:hypothetical protein